jgi:hypothetical protein
MPDPTARNHFYHGKLMDAYHFQLETDHLNAKRWLMNRLIGGTGVVCGLDVRPAPGNPNAIVVTPGVAIDRWGREIIVMQESAPLEISEHHVRTAIDRCRKPEECCVHLAICYHECLGDPSPVLAGGCGCHAECAPGTILERYCLEVRPGCAPEITLACRFPVVASPGQIDYEELVKWVTREKRCLHLPKDPCIPLANIPVDADRCACKCGPEHIDISIRPIVLSNRLLWDLLLCLELGGPDQNPD